MENNAIAFFVFWMALFFLFYTYLGYPSVLWVRSRWRTWPVRKEPTYAPRVTFLIAAHNEEKVIRQKLENTLKLEYLGDHPEVVVASDGSTDCTNEIVREFKDEGVSLLAFPTRRGKAQTLNDAIPLCQGEIVIMSDARQMYTVGSLRELVANFHDPSVGAVTGDLQFQEVPGSNVGDQIGLYWRYEKWIRRIQSETDSTPVVTGAIYAIRRALFRPLPNGCIADDLAIPMNIIMQGFRVVCDPAAKAYDHYTRTLKHEFQRRVRTIAGSYQYLVLAPKVLSPKANRIWFDFLSHKVCRVLAPFALVALLLANLVIPAWPYRLALALQVAFYMMAGVGAILVNRGMALRSLSAPYTFLMLNAAASVALIKLLTGAQTHMWEKSQGAGWSDGTERRGMNKSLPVRGQHGRGLPMRHVPGSQGMYRTELGETLRRSDPGRWRSPFLVGIAGGTGAGKTTFARRLARALAIGLTVCLVDLDSYYKDLSLLPPGELERNNFDHPDSLDLHRFRGDLSRLRQGKAIIKPVYDFKTCTRHAGGAVLVGGDVVIAEGSMLFIDESVRELFDLRIFIDTPEDIRLRRRLERDVRERGCTLTDAIEHYTSSVLPMHERFIEPARDLPHVVVAGWENSEMALGELSSFIMKRIQREKRASPVKHRHESIERSRGAVQPSVGTKSRF